MEAAHDFCRIERRAPRNDESETREQHPEMDPGIVAGADPAAANAQRADHAVEQRHNTEGTDHEHERAVLEYREPGENADVVPSVVAQFGRVQNAEMRRRRCQNGVTPPIPRAQGQQRAEDYAEQDGGGEERTARHGFDDFQVAQPARHLDGTDRPVDDQQIAGDPRNRHEEDEGLQQPGEIAGGNHRLASREGAIPRAFRRLHRQPAAADQRSHQETGADQVQPAPVRACHAVTPRAASQPSTSAR